MRFLQFAALAVSAIIASGTVFAQSSDSSNQVKAHSITWSYDPARGEMLAVPQPGYVMSTPTNRLPAADTTTTATTYTGTIDILVTVNLVSTLPKGAIVRCSSSIALEYQVETKTSPTSTLIGSGSSPSTENVDAAVGSKATCKFSIPYSWTVPASNSTTTVTINGIHGSAGISVSVLDSVTAQSVLRVIRSTTVQLQGPTTIPPDGTTTTLTASTVL